MLDIARPFRPFLLALLFAFPCGLHALTITPLSGTSGDALTVTSLPDGSLLVAQTSGLVDHLAAEGTGFGSPMLWADLGESGKNELAGFAVDPDFLSSGYVYATLRSVVDGKTTLRLTRWRAAEGLVLLNRILVDDLPSGVERAGGVLRFGPDGKLWLGLGDGGVPATDVGPEHLRGVLLRFNPDGSIPDDNPTAGSPVYAWGLREPSGLAWQPETDRMYVLDRGPAIPRGTMDEVNVVEKGGNYGWPKHLGRETVKGVIKPVLYCTSGHSWIPGGAAFASSGPWKGSLLFAGTGEGILYRISLDTKSATKIQFYEELINGDLGPLVDVTEAPDGQLYLLSRDKLYRLTP